MFLCVNSEISFAFFSNPVCNASDMITDYKISALGFNITNVHVNTFVLSIFSCFSPIGGFIASAYKRALKIKDFSSLIPGHGGVTDRMDCQIVMGMFTYMYIYSFLAINESFKIKLLLNLINKMTLGEKEMVKDYLENIIHKDS